MHSRITDHQSGSGSFAPHKLGLGLGALVLLTCIATSGGCSWFGGGDEDFEQRDLNTTEQILYRQSQRSLRSGNYTTAIEALQRLEARFPFGRYAEQAQLEIIYAQFMSTSYDAARASADRFIRLHPQNANLDYAYYLKALAAYNKNRGMLDRLFASDISKRDMSSATQAYEDFGQLISNFPGSQYAADARQRMLYLRNVLARAELNVADYYMRRGALVAASNRARHVVETYSRSYAAADALALLVEANFKLGLKDAANDALLVLATNFPQYNAFNSEGELVLSDQIRNRDRSWTNMITFGLLDRPRVPPPIRLVQPEDNLPIADASDSSANSD